MPRYSMGVDFKRSFSRHKSAASIGSLFFGVAQTQSSGQTLAFTSQNGLVRVNELPKLYGYAQSLLSYLPRMSPFRPRGLWIQSLHLKIPFPAAGFRRPVSLGGPGRLGILGGKSSVRDGPELLRVQSKGLELLAPFGWRIAQPLDSDASR